MTRGFASVGRGFGVDGRVISNSVIIDDFEDGDIAEYSGDTGNFSTSTTPIQNGTNSLEASTSGSSVAIHSSNGLDSYFDQGETMRVWMRTGTNTDINQFVSYFAQKEGSTGVNRYYVELARAAGVFRLIMYDGSANILASASQTYSDSTWYEVEVNVTTGGDHTLTLLDSSGSQLNQIAVTDTTYSDGGVGFGLGNAGSSSATHHFDYARVV